MDLSKIKPCDGDCVSVLIEIPYASNIKYEFDKDNGVVLVDRIMHSAVYYPANYGFVPNTLADDGDPIDILVLGEYPIQSGCIIKTRLIGMLVMEDESGMDGKLISVPISKVDPTYDAVQSLNDLPKIILDRIRNFFETYKLLEPGKWVKVRSFEDVNYAKKILDKVIYKYNKGQ